MSGRTKTADQGLSDRLSVLVEAEEGQCARNASRAIIEHVDQLPKGTVYVEGAWLKSSSQKAEPHAWLETTDGTVIDPTAAVVTWGAVYAAVESFDRKSVVRRSRREQRRFERELEQLKSGSRRGPVDLKLYPRLSDDPRVNHAEELLNEDECDCPKAVVRGVSQPFTLKL